MLLGLTEISAGEARVFGHDPMREPLAVKRHVGYLPDAVGFYDNLTAADNLHYTGAADGLLRGRAQAAHRRGARPRRPCRGRREESRHLLARHAAAAWA